MFEKEDHYYQRHRNELITHHKRKYALIKNDALLGIFDTEEAAFDVGIQKLGIQPFYLKQILDEDEIIEIPALTLGLINAHS